MSIKNIDQSNIPQHVAVIMDGNGRWAKKRGLKREKGHREGRTERFHRVQPREPPRPDQYRNPRPLASPQ